jgi:acetyl esterase
MIQDIIIFMENYFMILSNDIPLQQHEIIYSRIRETGKVFPESLPDDMGRLYAPLLANSPKDGVETMKDIAYGPDERNLLDVYMKKGSSNRPMPILVFFHGGGFVSGDKSLCKNIGYYFARNNLLTIIPSYRLAPEHKWPSGPEDVANVIRWICLNAEKIGGDKKRIFLMGHSAGATHVSSYLYFNEFHAGVTENIAGAILMSGAFYDVKDISGPCAAYYGEDKLRYPSFSIIDRIQNSRVPLFIIYAEFDPPEFDYQSILLLNTVYYHYGVSPFIKRIINHNHISEVMQFNTGDNSIGPDILSFIYRTED